jgi:hypothetical protein
VGKGKNQGRYNYAATQVQHAEWVGRKLQLRCNTITTYRVGGKEILSRIMILIWRIAWGLGQVAV